jgi:hypothetical protein
LAVYATSSEAPVGEWDFVETVSLGG